MRLGRDIGVRIRIMNHRDTPQQLDIEPWGDQHILEAQGSFDIGARGPDGGDLLIELTNGGITLYGWTGSVLSLVQEEKE